MAAPLCPFPVRFFQPSSESPSFVVARVFCPPQLMSEWCAPQGRATPATTSSASRWWLSPLRPWERPGPDLSCCTVKLCLRVTCATACGVSAGPATLRLEAVCVCVLHGKAEGEAFVQSPTAAASLVFLSVSLFLLRLVLARISGPSEFDSFWVLRFLFSGSPGRDSYASWDTTPTQGQAWDFPRPP